MQILVIGYSGAIGTTRGFNHCVISVNLSTYQGVLGVSIIIINMPLSIARPTGPLHGHEYVFIYWQVLDIVREGSERIK